MPVTNLHLRSNVKGKEPAAGTSAGQLPVGSIAINFNADEPFLCIQDSVGNVRRIAGVAVGTAAPATPSAGEFWLDTSATDRILKVHDGSSWAAAGKPIPDASTTLKGIVQLADAAAITAGTVGRVVDAAQLKAHVPASASETVKGIVELATVAEAEAGTDTVRAVTPAGLKSAIIKVSGGASGTAPTSPSIGQVWTDTSKTPPVMQVWDGTKWVEVGAAPADATATKKGVVQLADAAAITAGTAGRVVDAAQLKVAAVWSRTGTTLSPSTAGDLLVPAVMPAATTTAQGAIQLATAAEVLAGTDALKAVTPKEAKDHYLAKNIALLPALP